MTKAENLQEEKVEKVEKKAKNVEINKQGLPKSKIHFPKFKEVIKAMFMVALITTLATIIFFGVNILSSKILQETIKMLVK